MRVEFFADTEILRDRFEKLVGQADEIKVAVAWAGKPDSGVQDLLWEARDKVRTLVVGCTLLNTHPDFLERWQRHATFKVVMDTTEVFHPKVYLFRAGREFSLLVGSSNLTDGGFEKNREANILLSGTARGSGAIAEAAAYIHERYREASKPEGPEWRRWLKNYRSCWKRKPKSTSLTRKRTRVEKAGGAKERTVEGLEDWSFSDYLRKLKAGNPATGIKLKRWLDFLEEVGSRWKAAGWSLQRMPKEGRRLVAGKPVSDGDQAADEAGLFGLMGLGHFLRAVINAPAKVDQALQCIPRTGPVDESHWSAFSRAYSHAFPNAATGSGSRLLCLWRPDVFFSANRGSIPEIARRFGTPQSSLKTWDGYWGAVKWVRQRPWARARPPEGRLAQRCWRARIALLDVLMYEPVE